MRACVRTKVESEEINVAVGTPDQKQGIIFGDNLSLRR